MKTLENEKVVREVAYCGYGEYQSVIKATSASLSKKLSATEEKVLALFRSKWNDVETVCYSKTILFGDQSKGLAKGELAALVKLIRRGLVNVYLVFASGVGQGGYRHLWEVTSPEGA